MFGWTRLATSLPKSHTSPGGRTKPGTSHGAAGSLNMNRCSTKRSALVSLLANWHCLLLLFILLSLVVLCKWISYCYNSKYTTLIFISFYWRKRSLQCANGAGCNTIMGPALPSTTDWGLGAFLGTVASYGCVIFGFFKLLASFIKSSNILLSIHIHTLEVPRFCWIKK